MFQSLKRFLSNFNVVAIQNSLDGFSNTLYVRNNSKTSRWFPFIKSLTICNWFLAVTEKRFCIAICLFRLWGIFSLNLYKRKTLKVPESKVNNELVNIHTWLTFVIFHPPRRKLPFHIILSLNSINLNQEYSEKISKYCNIF